MIPEMTHIAPPLFGGAEVAVDTYLVDPNHPEPATGDQAAAFSAFRSLTTEDLLELTPHVVAYAQDFGTATGQAASYDPETIWAEVTPNEAFVEKLNGDWHVCVEADCSWEPEHGLMLVWRHGKELVKVGPFDGQLANTAGDDVIYDAQNPKFTTRRG